MNEFVLLIICALAVHRLAEMLSLDDGPFDIFMNLRGWLNQAPMESWNIKRTLSNLLTCVHCAGFWLALLFGLLFASSSIVNYLLYSIAIAGLQSILACNFGRTKL